METDRHRKEEEDRKREITERMLNIKACLADSKNGMNSCKHVRSSNNDQKNVLNTQAKDLKQLIINTTLKYQHALYTQDKLINNFPVSNDYKAYYDCCNLAHARTVDGFVGCCFWLDCGALTLE